MRLSSQSRFVYGFKQNLTISKPLLQLLLVLNPEFDPSVFLFIKHLPPLIFRILTCEKLLEFTVDLSIHVPFPHHPYYTYSLFMNPHRD